MLLTFQPYRFMRAITWSPVKDWRSWKFHWMEFPQAFQYSSNPWWLLQTLTLIVLEERYAVFWTQFYNGLFIGNFSDLLVWHYRKCNKKSQLRRIATGSLPGFPWRADVSGGCGGGLAGKKHILDWLGQEDNRSGQLGHKTEEDFVWRTN